MDLEGKIVANGTEQLVCETSALAVFSGFISLSQMQLGDKVILRQYVDIGNGFEEYHEDTYADAQESSLVHFLPMELASKTVRVTLEQTAGAFREFRFKYYKEAPQVVFQI